jgi:hypothetical protein
VSRACLAGSTGSHIQGGRDWHLDFSIKLALALGDEDAM